MDSDNASQVRVGNAAETYSKKSQRTAGNFVEELMKEVGPWLGLGGG
jgi:hypothetical protein